MLPQALAGISLFLFSLFLFSLFSLPVQKATLGRAGPAVKLEMLLQALAGSISLFLFSLFSLPVQKATFGTAGPAFKRYKCFRRPLQVSLSFSLSLFSFLFTGSESNVRHGRSRLQTLQMLPQALAGISLFLFSLFLFSLFSLPVQKATLGRAGPAHKRYKCFCRPSQVVSLFLFSLFSLPVQKATLGTAGPAVKLQMLLQALAGGISLFSLSLFSFLFTGSESNVRHGRSRLQTLHMLPQALAGISLFLFSLFLFSLFSLPVQKATLGRAGPAFKRYKCFRRPLSLFLFSLFSLPVQKATLGRAGPAFKRYKCFRKPLQVSLFLFSLFSLPVQKATLGTCRSRPQTLQMPLQALAGILSFSFLFSLYRFRKQR